MYSLATDDLCIKCHINRSYAVRCSGCTCKRQHLCQVCLSRSMKYIRITCQYCDSPYQVKATYNKKFPLYYARWTWVIPLIIGVIRVHATCTLDNTIVIFDILLGFCFFLPLYMFFVPVSIMVVTGCIKNGYMFVVLSRACTHDLVTHVFISFVTRYNINIMLDILIFVVIMLVRLAHILLHVRYVLLMTDGIHIDMNNGIHIDHNEQLPNALVHQPAPIIMLRVTP
jgi:hypothetical protein